MLLGNFSKALHYLYLMLRNQYLRIIFVQETLKELVTWKAKAEQQLMELSNAVLALKGQNQPNWRYP